MSGDFFDNFKIPKSLEIKLSEAFPNGWVLNHLTPWFGGGLITNSKHGGNEPNGGLINVWLRRSFESLDTSIDDELCGVSKCLKQSAQEEPIYSMETQLIAQVVGELHISEELRENLHTVFPRGWALMYEAIEKIEGWRVRRWRIEGNNAKLQKELEDDARTTEQFMETLNARAGRQKKD